MLLTNSLNNFRLPDLASTPAALMLARWRAEMLQCLPEEARQWLLQRQPPTLIVSLDESRALLMRELGGERTTLAVLDPPGDVPLATAVPRPRQGWRAVVVELPAAWMLERSVRMPAQVKDNLHQVVGYELDRLTPFSANAVYFATTVAGDRRGTGGRLDARLALCRRDQVDPWLERLRVLDVEPSRLSWHGGWSGANLLPAGQRPRRRDFGWLINLALLAVIAGLMGLVLTTPVQQKQDELLRLNMVLRGVRAEAEQVPDIRAELERARAGSVAVIERKTAQPRLIDLLRELTERLPDHTWVQTINVRDDEVDIRGESDQATELLGLLSQVPGVTQVSFRSPVMQVSSSGKERFHIAFHYQRPDS